MKIKEKKQLEEIKNIDESRTLKAISEIGRKNDKTIKILDEIKKIDANLILQNLFVQKLMELNTTLILLRFH